LDIAMQTVLMIIISIIVALAIMNTMLMAIQERFTEFGVMAAIGTRPGQIIAVLMTESFFLGLLGLAAGALVTMLGLIYLFWHGVNLSAFSAGVMKLIGMDTTVRPLVQLKQVVVSSLVVLLSGTLVSILPALRAAHLEPVEAIRHI
ncbi:MAG TPA: FtsX-like permease family protein, partial [bacterium]|nr:FtsX-like permease family protein [bacterium]